MRAPVQSLWVGNRLTVLERMAIRSFLANEHSYHLYTYDVIEGLPEGVVVEDANKILPRRQVFGYSEGFAQGSPAAFSNFFRYKLLLERGGWWVDTDVVCLRPFELDDVRLWGTERMNPPQELIVSTSVIKAPAGDPLMAWTWEACQRLDTSTVKFGDIGPRLLQAGVDALGAHAFMRPHTFFSPVPFYDWHRLIEPSQTFMFGTEVYGVHLWNQMWLANGVDKDAEFPHDCFYEHLKRRYSGQ